MSKADSNARVARGKPQKSNKPDADFPLFAHAAGVRAKKIRSQMHYFGKGDDPTPRLRSTLQK